MHDSSMFAKSLAEFCLRGGLTREQAARLMGSTPMTLHRWATGKTRPHPATAKRVADVLGVDPVELWGLP